MNFNNNQISIVEKLVDDRIYFLKENNLVKNASAKLSAPPDTATTKFLSTLNEFSNLL